MPAMREADQRQARVHARAQRRDPMENPLGPAALGVRVPGLPIHVSHVRGGEVTDGTAQVHQSGEDMKYRKKPVVIEAEQYKAYRTLSSNMAAPDGVFKYTEEGTLWC